jgi:hypothetical protein
MPNVSPSAIVLANKGLQAAPRAGCAECSANCSLHIAVCLYGAHKNKRTFPKMNARFHASQKEILLAQKQHSQSTVGTAAM